MNNIYCLDKISAVGTNIFKENYQLTDDIKKANAILLRSSNIHELDFEEHLFAIARAGAGVNNIPLEKCASQGIVVFNTPGANANAVKELVISSMILGSRNMDSAIAWVRSIKDSLDIAKDVEKGKKQFVGVEINNKKLGIIGLGAIGTMLANAATHLGMEVLGYDPYISIDSAWNLSSKVRHIRDINKLFEECDYISLHLPLAKDKKAIINENSFENMKDGVIILNFSRDLLVDELALKKALESKKVKKYITDFANENSINLPNTIILPHLGASTNESEQNCASMASRQIKDYLENGNIKNSVNYPDCDMGSCSSICRLCLLHKNIPNMIGQISAILASHNINISDMTNKSRDKFAYTMLDLETLVEDKILNELLNIDGVLKVRLLK